MLSRVTSPRGGGPGRHKAAAPLVYIPKIRFSRRYCRLAKRADMALDYTRKSTLGREPQLADGRLPHHSAMRHATLAWHGVARTHYRLVFALHFSPPRKNRVLLSHHEPSDIASLL